MEEHTQPSQSKKVDKLYFDTKIWCSHIQFIKGEIQFIQKLLNSYVFEPTTHHHFERLHNYLERLAKAVKKSRELTELIRIHEKNLGGILECMDQECDLEYYQKHEKLKAELTSLQEDFRYLKSEIFNYAGGILKKRKPVD